MTQPEQGMRDALERIARLGLEPGDYDYEPMTGALDIALDALGWVYWSCCARFTRCECRVVGPRQELEAAGWVRDTDPAWGADSSRARCPTHSQSPDPDRWEVAAPHPSRVYRWKPGQPF
jgi:hypothetical protein